MATPPTATPAALASAASAFRHSVDALQARIDTGLGHNYAVSVDAAFAVLDSSASKAQHATTPAAVQQAVTVLGLAQRNVQASALDQLHVAPLPGDPSAAVANPVARATPAPAGRPAAAPASRSNSDTASFIIAGSLVVVAGVGAVVYGIRKRHRASPAAVTSAPASAPGRA